VGRNCDGGRFKLQESDETEGLAMEVGRKLKGKSCSWSFHLAFARGGGQVAIWVKKEDKEARGTKHAQPIGQKRILRGGKGNLDTSLYDDT